MLIDPGDEVAELLALPIGKTSTIRHILLTHAHVDHVTGVASAKRALGVPVYLHRDDLFLYERAVDIGRDVRTAGRTAAADRRASTRPDKPIAFGNFTSHAGITRRVTVRAAYACRLAGTATAGKDLFVGDTLFAGSIGRTDLTGRRPSGADRLDPQRTLRASATTRSVHPGHGPTTTIERERRTNPFLTGNA